MNDPNNLTAATVTTGGATPEIRAPRRIWASLARASAAAVLAVGAVFGLGTPAANAMIIGGCGSMCDIYNPPVFTSSPGSAVIAVQCGPGRIIIDPNVTVQAGYTNGQYITYRYHVTNSRGYVGTSAWSKPKWIPYATTSGGRTYLYAYSSLPGTNWGGLAPASWTVQVQLGYWNGRSYTYSNWLRPSGGYSRPGSTFTWATCNT